MIKTIVNLFDSKIYGNKEILIDTNKVHRNIFYISKGVARIFYYDTKFREHTHWISSDGQFITLFSSILSQKEVPFGIQVIEKGSEIFTIPYSNLIDLKNSSPEFQEAFDKLLIGFIIEMGSRVIDIQTKSADQRYKDFVSSKPELLQRVNLGYISSYLGMSQQQLSKIRSNKT